VASYSIGGVPIFVISETPQFDNSLTSKPVEEELDISDHLSQDPVTINIKFVVDKNAVEVANKLIKLRDKKEVYTYTGVDFSYPNMAIKSLSIPINAKIKDGFEGSLSLQQVQIVKERSKVTKLGKDTIGKQVQKNNEETPKREFANTSMSSETWTFYN